MIGRYLELIRFHILVNCMELRWRQPCSDPVAPLKCHWGSKKQIRPRDLKKWKLKNRCTSTTAGRSFTSIQVFHTHTHTHALLPQGFFRKMHQAEWMRALRWSTGFGSVDQNARDKKLNYKEKMKMMKFQQQMVAGALLRGCRRASQRCPRCHQIHQVGLDEPDHWRW